MMIENRIYKNHIKFIKTLREKQKEVETRKLSRAISPIKYSMDLSGVPVTGRQYNASKKDYPILYEEGIAQCLGFDIAFY